MTLKCIFKKNGLYGKGKNKRKFRLLIKMNGWFLLYFRAFYTELLQLGGWNYITITKWRNHPIVVRSFIIIIKRQELAQNLNQVSYWFLGVVLFYDFSFFLRKEMFPNTFSKTKVFFFLIAIFKKIINYYLLFFYVTLFLRSFFTASRFIDVFKWLMLLFFSLLNLK